MGTIIAPARAPVRARPGMLTNANRDTVRPALPRAAASFRGEEGGRVMICEGREGREGDGLKRLGNVLSIGGGRGGMGAGLGLR